MPNPFLQDSWRLLATATGSRAQSLRMREFGAGAPALGADGLPRIGCGSPRSAAS
jgi:hypothetical protein